MRTLSFENGHHEELTLEELKQTVNERNTIGKPFNGITHYDLYDKILEITDKRNIKCEVGTIFATDSRNKVLPGISTFPHLEEQFGKGSLESFLLRRVIGKISFPDFSNDDSGAGIAINFHQRGIEMCYGQHVWICGNLSIHGNTFMSTYGEHSIPLEKIFDVYEDWLFKLSDFRNNDLKVMNKMKDTWIEPVVAIPELVGKLSILAVKSAYLDSKLVAPLNIGQVSSFTKNLLKTHGSVLTEAVNVWELTNLATEIMKPGKVNSEEILWQSNAIGKFFVEEYLEPSFVEQIVY